MTIGRPPKTHCLRGHERTPENLNSSNGCIKCVRLFQADLKRRKKLRREIAKRMKELVQLSREITEEPEPKPEPVEVQLRVRPPYVPLAHDEVRHTEDGYFKCLYLNGKIISKERNMRMLSTRPFRQYITEEREDEHDYSRTETDLHSVGASGKSA